MAKMDWLETKHPVWSFNQPIWEMLERRYLGGDAVLAELAPFRWELAGTPDLSEHGEREATILAAANESTYLRNSARVSYEQRKRQAPYINFAEKFTRILVGHLMRNAPVPGEGLDFGTLGDAGRREGEAAQRSQAEDVYYNVAGVGQDGIGWDPFWSTVIQHSIVTGHRWLFCDAASEAPRTRADELAGQRPYLVEYSPLSVTNWSFTQGTLDFAVITSSRRQPRLVNGKMEGNDPEDLWILLVRDGFEDFGDDYVGGGWWMFDADKELEATGDWSRTNGEIPLWLHHYERVTGDANRVSRSGIYEISQAAVAYMNLSSAADYDAFDAAQSMLYVLGCDKDGFNLMAEKIEAGARWVPVMSHKREGNVPAMYDGSMGAVTSGVFDTRLERKKMEAFEAAALEATGSPESSGESKKAGFADIRAPRLALLAEEAEASQNNAIRYFELRYGNASPSGEVNWQRDFDLLELIDSLREVFEIKEMADVDSETLTVNAIMAMVRQKNLARSDDEEELIEAEIRRSLADRRNADNAGETGDELEAEAAAAAEAALAAEGAQTPAELAGSDLAALAGGL